MISITDAGTALDELAARFTALEAAREQANALLASVETRLRELQMTMPVEAGALGYHRVDGHWHVVSRRGGGTEWVPVSTMSTVERIRLVEGIPQLLAALTGEIDAMLAQAALRQPAPAPRRRRK